MADSVDRRRFLAASAAAAAGALLPGAKIAVAAEDTPVPATVTVEEVPSGLLLRNGAESVRITVCADDVIHVVAAGQGMPGGASPETPWIIAPYGSQKPQVTRTEGHVAL